MHSSTKIIFACTALLLTFCTPSVPSQPIGDAKEGEFCGGIAGIMCAEGLTCQYEGTYPDAGGTCVKQ